MIVVDIKLHITSHHKSRLILNKCFVGEQQQQQQQQQVTTVHVHQDMPSQWMPDQGVPARPQPVNYNLLVSESICIGAIEFVMNVML